MIKLSFCLTRKSHLSRSEFQDYWINKHAPLVKSVSKDLKILKYDQIHCQNFDYLDTLRRARVPEGDFPHDYDGIAELYWGSWNIFKNINNEKNLEMLQDFYGKMNQNLLILINPLKCFQILKKFFD